MKRYTIFKKWKDIYKRKDIYPSPCGVPTPAVWIFSQGDPEVGACSIPRLGSPTRAPETAVANKLPSPFLTAWASRVARGRFSCHNSCQSMAAPHWKQNRWRWKWNVRGAAAHSFLFMWDGGRGVSPPPCLLPTQAPYFSFKKQKKYAIFNKWKYILRLNMAKMVISSKLIYRFNMLPVKISESLIFGRNW